MTVPASAIATAPASNTVPVMVSNPAPGGGSSPAFGFGLATATSTLAANVQPLLTASCATAMCHASSQPNTSLVLTSGQSYGQLVGVAADQCAARLRVKACDPATTQSYLIAKLKGVDLCQGFRMPKMAPLTAGQIQTIVDWVAQGAPQ